MSDDTRETWDIGDPEPGDDVTTVSDFTVDSYDLEDSDQPFWGRTVNGWKGYKNGYKQYLDWSELVRRWGPVRRG